ncbi:MAG TPA: ATP-binding protein [Streptosporangiaceae bacterium]|nr:ATP-binding protein [Streptosporangiaceae bacterium]
MQPHDEPLLDQVFNRLAGDDVPEQTATLVLAAYAGDGQLRAALAGDDPGLPAPGDDCQARIDPVYLESVTLAGFRGVGPQASLRLLPGPGLTLVVGRNGSGKSSFAEAAELCLTGNSPRWSEQSSVFREGWRNLHQASPCQVRVTVASQ